nr:MAG TPA: hypothetical protein [Bacteriophage sp.]
MHCETNKSMFHKHNLNVIFKDILIYCDAYEIYS